MASLLDRRYSPELQKLIDTQPNGSIIRWVPTLQQWTGPFEETAFEDIPFTVVDGRLTPYKGPDLWLR